MNDLLRDERRLRRLFFALALLYVLPLWTVRYLPTIDGACHTYNAWILRQYHNVEEYPLFQEHYEINARPYPNWTGHAVTALLMFVVPPLAAEKLMASLYVLTFLGGIWYFCGAVRSDQRWIAFLAFPFAYQQLFQYGFYNFSLSVALFPIILGFWWRRRHTPTPGFAVGINLLLWLCWFSHILSFGLALIAISVCWLATLRKEVWRRHLLHIPILAPQVILPLWFFSVQGSDVIERDWGFRQLLLYFTRLEVFLSFSPVQVWLGTAVAAVFLLLMILTVRRESFVSGRPMSRETDVFLLLAVLFTVLFFLSPEGMSGGYLMKQRLSLYPYLLLFAWLSPRLGRSGERIGAAVLTVTALLYLGYLVHWYGLLGREMRDYVNGLAAARPNTRLLTLNFRLDSRAAHMHIQSHAAGYAAIEKGLIDWENYEAKVPFFPVRFRESVVFPDTPGIAFAPNLYRPRFNRGLVDTVYVWKMPGGMGLDQRLRRYYRLVSDENGGALYEIRTLRRRENEVSRISSDRKASATAGSRSAAVSSSQP
ncbi:MAG TPA: hypothetical protein VF789_12390 [Thermoanaerobaculia bacterium]